MVDVDRFHAGAFGPRASLPGFAVAAGYTVHVAQPACIEGPRFFAQERVRDATAMTNRV